MVSIDLDKGGRHQQIRPTWLGPSKGWIYTDEPARIEFVITGNGQVISPGYQGGLGNIPCWLIVQSWTVYGNASGSIVVDVWRVSKATYQAGTVPTVANTIAGSDLPTISAGVFGQSSALTGWSTEIQQDDFIGFNVNSCSGISIATVVLNCVKSIGQFSGVGSS